MYVPYLLLYLVPTSVTDGKCLSQIQIFIHHGYRIPDPTTTTKEEREENICYLTFFVSTNFKKCKIYFVLNKYRKNLGKITNN